MRPYTGTKEGVGRGRRAGTERFASRIQADTAGRFWNNGTYQVRKMKGSNRISVHSTGRALDLSFRKTSKHPGADRAVAARLATALTRYEDELGLEMIVDYSFTGGLGGGRVWKCDRQAWKNATPGTIEGGGKAWADWLHIELSPKAADDPQTIDRALDLILAELTATPTPQPTETPKYPGRPLSYRSTGKAVEHIQRRLGIVVDGKFQGQTDAAVRAFQQLHDLTIDGIVGPITWQKMFGSL